MCVCVCVCVCVCACEYAYTCVYFILKGDEPAVKKLKREETSNGDSSNGTVQEGESGTDRDGEEAVENGEDSVKKDVSIAKPLSEVPFVIPRPHAPVYYHVSVCIYAHSLL